MSDEEMLRKQKKFHIVVTILFIVSIFIFIYLVSELKGKPHLNKLEDVRKATFDNYMAYKGDKIKLSGTDNKTDDEKSMLNEIMKAKSCEDLNVLNNEIDLLKSDLKSEAYSSQPTKKIITRNIEEYLSNTDKYEFEGVMDMAELKERDSGRWGTYNEYFIYFPYDLYLKQNI